MHGTRPGELYAGFSLHIALNRVDPGSYDGWGGALQGCINDGHAMLDIATKNGYNTITLFDELATRVNVRKAFEKLLTKALPADTILITYSGHGTQVPDPHRDEDDMKDEAWCLFDGLLIDDEIWGLLMGAPTRSRIILVSDSCHSGTIFRDFSSPRSPGIAQQWDIYNAKKEEYDAVPRFGKEKYTVLAGTIITLSGCQDNQYSMDGSNNGLFTEKLLEVYDGGNFRGNYYDFMKAIQRKMPVEQSPQISMDGQRNMSFVWSQPFAIR